ncbi:hypothetical protein B0J13DRAFT_661335 [Dactylonectria estremocensis]|uniref:Zn(2)-C6 fungal-type domain-containing protein n=1 Tax=Dactylonectria estremocensis TaxID=1079267 RepID=A0A9P9F1N0_9HYPO|nr:hypothetical protein B0J13DRAFT_661335 [Dactylonectria estremocensis]
MTLKSSVSSFTADASSTHQYSTSMTSSPDTIHHPHCNHYDADGIFTYNRVRKACERCRMKKTRCNGEFPCRRCREDGLICSPNFRKAKQCKKPPKGYAEVIENSQVALTASVNKLYSMVRNGEKWDFDDPVLNHQGQPIAQSIAQILGCLRPDPECDLPDHLSFPEDQASMAELSQHIQEKQGGEHKHTSDAEDTETQPTHDSVELVCPCGTEQSGEFDKPQQASMCGIEGTWESDALNLPDNFVWDMMLQLPEAGTEDALYSQSFFCDMPEIDLNDLALSFSPQFNLMPDTNPLEMNTGECELDDNASRHFCFNYDSEKDGRVY